MAMKLEKELRKEHPGCKILFEENWVDLTVFTDSGLIFFELKPDLSARVVIRQALGQILEYAYFRPQERPVEKLVIVGRSDLTKEEKVYFDRLKKFFPTPIEYRKIAI